MSEPTPTLTTGLFKGLSPEDADQILGAGERSSYAAGTAIFNQGDQGDAMFVISSGEARVDVGGRFHTPKPGDFFGEMALLAPGPRMATVNAESDIDAVMIRADAFQSFLLEHPALAASMTKQRIIRLREVEQRIDAWMA